MRRVSFIAGCLLTIAYAAGAADLYVVQGFADGRPIDAASRLRWSTDVLLFNSRVEEATIVLKDISNGGLSSGQPPTLRLLPGRSVSLVVARPTWQSGTDPLWVLRLEVPDGVDIQDMLYIGSTTAVSASPASRPYRFGATRLPIFRTLVPAGEVHAHLGTDLGPEVISHVNVAIFNAGTSTAIARIEVRQHCDDALLDARTMLIDVNRIVQAPSLQVGPPICADTPGIGGPPFSVYTLITVDQPSFSLVSTVSDSTNAPGEIHVSGSSARTVANPR